MLGQSPTPAAGRFCSASLSRLRVVLHQYARFPAGDSTANKLGFGCLASAPAAACRLPLSDWLAQHSGDAVTVGGVPAELQVCAFGIAQLACKRLRERFDAASHMMARPA